jgi:HAMP domain-containing protein
MTASHAALLILLLAVLACLLARLLGRRSLAPLAEITTNFSGKLRRHQAIAWPYSFVTDIEALAGTFRAMVEVLQRNVHEIQRTNETLEFRVQDALNSSWKPILSSARKSANGRRPKSSWQNVRNVLRPPDRNG